FEIVEHLLEAAGEQEIALFRQFAHEELENRRLVHALVEVGLQHGELVEIGEQHRGAHDRFSIGRCVPAAAISSRRRCRSAGSGAAVSMCRQCASSSGDSASQVRIWWARTVWSASEASPPLAWRWAIRA